MKRSFKRAFPLFIVSLMLILALPLSGCRIVTTVLRRAFLGETPRPRATATVKPGQTADKAGTPNPRPSADAGQWEGMPGIIPLDEIYAPAEYTSPTLSGDGKLVLYRHISPDGSADDIVVRNMATGAETVVPYPQGVSGIPYFEWSGDSRHVLYMIDDSGDENYGIYSVDVTTGKSKTLFRQKDRTAIIVSLDDRNPNGIFYQCNERDLRYFDLYWCDISTGESELIMENPGYVSGWYFDRNGYCRIVKIMDEDGGERLLYKKTAGADSAAFILSDWEEILRWEYSDVDTSGFMGFSLDGKRIQYLDSTGRNTAAVMEMDLETNSTKLVYEDPEYDVASTWHDLKLDRVTAVQVARDRSEWLAFEDGLKKQFDYVKTLSGGDFSFMSSSEDDRYWLISFDSDTDGRSYYYVDSETLTSAYLFHETPILRDREFAPMEPISYTASDGLKIHGYATFPAGLERKNLPMVLLVHGGPQYRDTWGFNAEVQWLANRGYLVVQVNFRGSTGYGKTFVRAGDREWGGKMQQDLTDAVNWAVSQGYADRSRVAIMGASYGGYAALAGAAFTPDVYACAVDMFGPSSLLTLAENMPTYWEDQRKQLYQSIGDPSKDEAFMKSRSPLYSADKIKIPVLITQGGNDSRVTPRESEQMVEAMKAKNLDVRYLFFPEAGHGFNTTADEIEFYRTAEEFLAENIGGRIE